MRVLYAIPIIVIVGVLITYAVAENSKPQESVPETKVESVVAPDTLSIRKQPGEQFSVKKDSSRSLLEAIPINLDLELGAAAEADIISDSASYPILDRSDAPEAYALLEKIKADILASGDIRYVSDFPWKIHIVNDDIVNAFATAGGYIYIYTGLLNHVESDDELAGIVAHEFAHADERHIIKIMGVDVLQQILSRRNGRGNSGELLKALVDAQYSQAMETDADIKAVTYLCQTDWDADAFANFFAADNSSNAPGYLSSHPSDAMRVENITTTAEQLGCN